MKHVRDESEERLIHRLESFSDIVIGFSLAQLGLSMVLPARAIELYTKPLALTAFVVTFTIVCRLWWSHHKLFTHFFVPQRFAIALNFATLGVLLFCVYSVQLFVHFKMRDPVAVTTYMCSFGLLFLMLGTQYLYGWKARRHALPLDVAQLGFRDGMTLVAGGAAFITGGAAFALLGASPMTFAWFALAVVFFVRGTRALIGRFSQHRAPQIS